MARTDERDERDTTSDEVEGHLLDSPPSERPPADRNDEGDDVEAHMPPSERPPSD